MLALPAKILSKTPLTSRFEPPWWCFNPHLQTLWPFLFRPSPLPLYRRERLELDDGDFVDLDWFEPISSGPIVVILHGLGGNSQSHYIRGLTSEITALGLRSVVMHHRGCSGEPNRLARSYHAGDSADLDFTLRRIRAREPDTLMFAVGYSLGASVLLNFLSTASRGLVAASVVSTPFDLAAGAQRMERGTSRLYQWHLLSHLKLLLVQKSKTVCLPIDLHQLGKVRTFRDFDEFVTAPLHGFSSAEDYYSSCSTRKILSLIRTPTLIIHAEDDPLMTTKAIPHSSELSSAVKFELSKHGGHCGFVSGRSPHQAVYWAEQRIARYLASFLTPNSSNRLYYHRTTTKTG